MCSRASQNPIIVGQGAYNSAYGTTFQSNGPDAGLVQIFDTSVTFKTLLGGSGGPSLTIPLQPKSLHDEMGAAYDQEYGRMSCDARGGGADLRGGPAEHDPVPVHVPPGRCPQGARGGRDGYQPGSDPHRFGRRRDADLEDHAQRGGHAPHPLAHVRRATAQPGRLGRGHPQARRQRAGLEGNGPRQPAGRHYRGHPADRAACPLRSSQQHPPAQPDDARGRR